MRRLEKYLGPDERTVYASRQHPIVLAGPVVMWVISMAVIALVTVFVNTRTDSPLFQQIVGVAVIVMTIYAAVKVLMWSATIYAFTDHRAILVSGLLSVRVAAIPLAKVNDTTFTRSFAGRLLGYGDLILESAGEHAGLSALRYLPKPNQAYRELTSLVAGLGDEPEPDAGAGRPEVRAPGPDDTGPLPRFQ